MESSLIILPVLLPIFAGVSFFLSSRIKLIYFFSLLVSVFLFSVAVMIFLQTLQVGFLSYNFGGWDSKIGIAFKVTKLRAFFALLISGVLLFVNLQSALLFKSIAEEKITTFLGVLFLCFAGFFGIIVTNDLFNMYVFIEIASLTSYALSSVNKTHYVSKFALDYLIVGTISATLILLGIGYLYSASGTLNIDNFIDQLPLFKDSKSLKLGRYLVVFGLCVKSALFPFHGWMVNVYRSTNAFILTFFAGVSSKVYISLLILLEFSVFAFYKSSIFLVIMGVFAALVGASYALRQSRLRGMLIFSSVAQTGYIFIALGVSSVQSIPVCVALILSNILTKISLFALCGRIELLIGHDDIKHLYNLKSKMPITTVLFIANSLSVIGFPITSGFMAKFHLLSFLLYRDMFFLSCVILFSSLASLIYSWRFMECFLYPKNMNHKIIERVNIFSEFRNDVDLLPIILVTMLNIFVGLFFVDCFNFVGSLIG